ncbi:hypothetical protein P171DRAFT_169230 [Karstenula rhodostoma CBS 690.94]|uniref:Uncharacterized protein n=1 Tax=Karstenula rhodostoma CBS 690.94 TaxID=1392251 RepID=A0A9P4P7Y5_9PLEO|nr:hypothetical protein P171DRAFT_169230 [Karstenula rhodostoma CBS 690.94]
MHRHRVRHGRVRAKLPQARRTHGTAAYLPPCFAATTLPHLRLPALAIPPPPWHTCTHAPYRIPTLTRAQSLKPYTLIPGAFHSPQCLPRPCPPPPHRSRSPDLSSSRVGAAMIAVAASYLVPSCKDRLRTTAG